MTYLLSRRLLIIGVVGVVVAGVHDLEEMEEMGGGHVGALKLQRRVQRSRMHALTSALAVSAA